MRAVKLFLALTILVVGVGPTSGQSPSSVEARFVGNYRLIKFESTNRTKSSPTNEVERSVADQTYFA